MGALLAAAKAEGIETTDKAELCQHPKVIAAVSADIAEVCKAGRLQKFEVPQKVILVDDLWTPDNDVRRAPHPLRTPPSRPPRPANPPPALWPRRCSLR